MSHPIYRVRSFEIVSAYTLHVRFEDGIEQTIDFRPILAGDPDVPEIRQHLGLTQEKFALLLGVSTATLRNWEQGRRKPEGAARVLLCVAAKNPKAVLEVVGG